MRVVLWNVQGGPSDNSLASLKGRDWDVAVLLEVDAKGAARLESSNHGWAISGSFQRSRGSGPRYSVAVVVRSSATLLEPIPPPPDFASAGERFEERVHAAVVRHAGETWMVVGTHMPNAVSETRPRNRLVAHASKEACYRALVDWLENRKEALIVVGMDTNRGDWPRSRKDVKPYSCDSQLFVREQKSAGLRDAFVHCHEPSERPQTWWRSSKPDSYYYDRIFVSGRTLVHDARISVPLSPVHPYWPLSDHAVVEAELAPSVP